MSGRLVTVDDRHLEIHQNDVEDELRLERSNRLSSVFGQSDLMSVLLQSLLDDHTIDRFILREQASQR